VIKMEKGNAIAVSFGKNVRRRGFTRRRKYPKYRVVKEI